jgi:hypothetical protein
MLFLRTNTAVRITVGPCLDATDGVTPETSLTVTNCSCELFYDDDDNTATHRTAITLTASGGDNDMVHVTDDTVGMYDLELTAAQLNFTGRARLVIIDTDVHCPVFLEFTVLAANVYDSLFGGAGITADKLQVDAAEVSGDSTAADTLELFAEALDQATGQIDSGTLHDDTITAASINTGALTSDAFAAGAITATAIADNAITAAKIADGAIDAATFAADVDAEILSYVVDDATRIDASALNTASGTSIPAILADTGTDGVVVAAASKTGYTLAATTGLGNQTANITGTVSGNSTHSAADVVTAIGTGSTFTAVPWNAAWDAEVQSECTDALNAYDPPTNAEMEARTLASAAYATAAALTTLDTLADRIAVLCIGNVTGAGTGTEVFTYGSVTGTVTVDSSGNRTIVFS